MELKNDAVLPATTEQFGGLIFTDYPERHASQTVAFVQHLPESKPVFLFPKLSPVYTQLANLAKSRPNIHLVDTGGIAEGEWMGGGSHSTSNLHAIEDLWAQMGATLRSQRTSVSPKCLSAGAGQCSILIHYSYDAWRHAADGSPVYVGSLATILLVGLEPYPSRTGNTRSSFSPLGCRA